MPLVSVVMPVYNASVFLRAAIESIINQSFKDFELILINDGSTDDSEIIIRSYNDVRIRYKFQQNGGVANALNTGLRMAAGKYIWRHDADDTSLPDKLKQQVEFLEKNPVYALCATQIAFMTERGKIALNFRQPKDHYFDDAPFIEVKREHFNPYSPITHATVLIKRDIIEEFRGFRTEFLTAEDVDLWLRIIQKHKAAVLNSCNYFVRLNKASATKRHGWKNEFYRNLAFKFYDQRERTGKDDLERGIPVVLPKPPASITPVEEERGKRFRGDLLHFHYPLNLNAKDYKGAAEIIKYAVADGWKVSATWKAIIIPVLGRPLVKAVVKTKKLLSISN